MIKNSQINTFKQDAQKFIVSLCSHAMDTSPMNYIFARCLKCLSPQYMAKCAESCEAMVEKLLSKMA